MKFILKINESESEKAAYVGWTPVKCTLTIEGYTGQIPMPVTITTGHDGNEGRLSLYDSNATTAQPVNKIEHDFKNQREVTFYIAGQYPYASVAKKDTFIRVESQTNEIDTQITKVMVRVRKNANNLSDDEITMFLEAFVRLNTEKTKKNYNGNYTNKPSKLLGEIVLMHTYDAIYEIHQRTSFHPWHRIFNMHLERELQAIIPHVTIPYWKFDKKAEHVFTPKFIGETAKSNNSDSVETMQPKFDKMNPLVNYINNTAWGPLNRAYRDRNPASQDTFGRSNGKRDVLTEEKIIEEGPNTFEQWASYEEGFSHNSAHNVFTGDVADVGKDPIDPLFFMMHSNVDRLWAKWQDRYNRFDSNQKEAYPHQGKYQGKRGDEWIKEWNENATQDDLDFFNAAGFYKQSNKDIGNFLNDTLWPWDLDTTDSRPMRRWNGDIDPEFGRGEVPEIEIEFPESATSNYPNGPITVKSTIDFQDRHNNKISLGFDYDDIPYFDHDKKPSIDIAMDHLKDNIHFQKDGEKHNQALGQLENNKNNLNVRINALAAIDETSEAFLDTILKIVANPDEPTDLRVELIDEMTASKRSNRFFPSRKPRFFDILRGLITDKNQKLRLKAIAILASAEDAVVQEFLVEEVKKEKSDFISKPDAIFFLRQSPKPQHAQLFKELFFENKDTDIRKAAIEGLGNDPDSEGFLKKVVLDEKEDFKIREASALSLHNLNHELMNDLAAQIITEPESGANIKLFKNIAPDQGEVDFKAGLLNMLTFTGDINRMKQNEELKVSLKEVTDPGLGNKAKKFLSTFETFKNKPVTGPTIIEQMAAKLLNRLEGNEES